VLLTPRFGPRQRVQMILTDAKLKPTPLLKKPVCPRSDACRGVCPLGALSGSREIVISGKRMAVANIDHAVCRSCKNGARPNRFHAAGNPDRLAAVCVRSCVDFLEREGRVTGGLAKPFRRRKAWVIRNETDFYKA
jgi:ferredoxin